MTTENEQKLDRLIKKVIIENKEIIIEYENGKKGLIGTIMNKIIKESTVLFYSKSSKQKLVLNIKKNLNDKKINSFE